MISDFRRSHLGTVLDHERASNYLLTEIQNSLTEGIRSLTFESLNLRIPSVYVRDDQFENTQTAKNIEFIERIVSNTKLFNEQKIFLA